MVEIDKRDKAFAERPSVSEENSELFQELYQPQSVPTHVDVMDHTPGAKVVVGKVLEKFACLQAYYNVLSTELVHLKDGAPTQLVTGFDPGHTLVASGEQVHHRNSIQAGFH
ncbi:hypothetical protein DSO57_1008585 [Entomophthora muscae]|uniref:Uncharacterized protein n=1 Tax=Entomophthora muscae TaxID=34485 RepID=A0ACC2RLR8_9FUNG|nr:hypothetical protein DSO57_1008585 [Entomophthora muscae]